MLIHCQAFRSDILIALFSEHHVLYTLARLIIERMRRVPKCSVFSFFTGHRDKEPVIYVMIFKS
jgi:hypothetical protein